MKHLNINASDLLSSILIGEIKKHDSGAEQDIYDRWQKNIDAYHKEQRRFINVIKSPAFLRGLSQALSLGFNRLSSEQERKDQMDALSERTSKMVVDAKHSAIASYLEAHPDIATQISLSSTAQNILRPLLKKHSIPELQPYLGL